MKRNIFWILSACALIIIANVSELNLTLRITLLANAIIISIDIIKVTKSNNYIRKETQNN